MNRWWWIGGAAVLAVVALGLGTLGPGDPSLPPDRADGAYVNYCCGTIELSGGRMVLQGGRSVAYDVKVDDTGPYVLPRAYVGTWEDRGFEVDGTRSAEKLRLDKVPEPTRIDLPAARGSYRFERKVPIKLPD